MVYSPLTSHQVLAFLPTNTWTEVILVSNTSTDNGVYIVTTEEKEKKRIKDSEKILLQSNSYEKIKEFKAFEIVAVEIKGKWFRGKLISFNEFQDNDTRMELIDIGSVHQTKLQNVFALPYYLLYEPLALPIKFKDFVPKTTKLKIKPLLSESKLYEGVVLVDVDCNNFLLNNSQNGHKEDIKKDFKFDCDTSIPSIEKMTNGHANVSSSYLSNSFRKGSFHSQKKLCYDVPFKNGDCCVITFFDGFTSVYVVKALKSDTDNSFKIHDSNIMSETAKSTDKHIKSNPVVGDIVRVFSLSKNSFCRAKMLKNYNDGKYDVFYIDFGNIEKVSSNNIFELADELKKKPGLAVKIGIDDLIRVKCSEEITNMFDKFIQEKKVFVIEFDERAESCLEHVKLKERNGSYLNLNYLNCLSTKSLSPKKNQELNSVHNTENICNSLNYDDHITNEYQESISNTKCNAENIDEFSIEKSKNIGNNLINKTKKCVIDDFQNITLVNGDLCLVSYFKNFHNIYMCKAVKTDNEDYETHNTNILLKTLTSTDKKIKKNPVVGDIVKAFSTEFYGMYRAEILNIENDGSFLVSYIDFGNTEIVQSSDLFELSNELFDKENKLPVRVSIKVPSNSKETEEIEKLFKVLIDNNIVLSIEFNEKNTNGLENVILKYLESGKSVNDEILKLLPTVKIPLKNGDSCILTHFDDFDSIYVSKSHLKENGTFIENVLNSTDRKFKAHPLPEEIVKVLSPTYNDFYRAKILNIENNGDIHVFYIDFGNTEVVQSNNIFELSDDLKMKPELAIKIGIQIPSYVKLNEKLKAMFTDLAEEISLLSIEFDETSEVGLQNCILKVISSGLNVNEEAIKLFSTQSSSSSVENFDVEIEKPVNSQEVGTIKPLRNREGVFVTYFYNSTAIFVRKASENDNFFNVLEKTQEKTRNISNIKIGDIVKVPYKNLMYRASILEKKDQDHFHILFIDFGNEGNVLANQIFELPDELKKFPVFCIKIGMKGFQKFEQSKIVDDYFEKLSEEMLFIEYDENNPNGLNEVCLKTENNIDIYEELCKIVNKPIYITEESIEKSENTAENKQILSNMSETERTSVELKCGDTVFCCNFEDFDIIYLCKSSKNNTIPENCSVIINTSKLKDLTIRKNPELEEIVWVKFEEKLVRAKVLYKCGKTCIVFLVDIGKSLSVSADNIFEIANDLKQIPGFAIKVGLKRTLNLKTSRAIKDYFHNLWYDNPVPLTLICDEGNINYLNEVNLKKLSDGQDIIDDLFEICGMSNDVLNKQNYIAEDKKSNGSNNNHIFLNGDHVQFLCGNNINNIHIRSLKLYNSYKHILEQLQGEKRENLKTITPKPYEIVAVYSLKLNGVYRAKIIGHYDDNSNFRCVLIDFGVTDVVKSKNIFTLPSYALINKVPLLTHKVVLADLTKIFNVNNNIIAYLTSMEKKTFVLEYDKNSEHWYKQVILRNLQNGKSMNEEIHKLLSHPSTDTSTSQQRRLERKIIPIVNKTKEIKMEKLHFPVKSGSYVNITHFENFNAIYIRDATYENLELLFQLNLEMKKCYRHNYNFHNKKMINIGDMVCVSTNENQVMHCRASVLQINENKNEYTVFNVDYGNTEIVKCNDIFELPDELKKFSYFAVKVQLRNMPQLKTKIEYQVIKDYFKKRIIGNNSKLLLEFNEYNSKGLDDVIFKTEYSKKNIAEDLCNLLNAPQLNIKTGLNQNTENLSSTTATSNPSPYPARRDINASK